MIAKKIQSNICGMLRASYPSVSCNLPTIAHSSSGLGGAYQPGPSWADRYLRRMIEAAAFAALLLAIGITAAFTLLS